MLKIVCMVALLTLTACATLTADSNQEIAVTTTPDGAVCQLSNMAGTWTINETPGIASVKRSFSPLTIVCQAGQTYGSQTVEASTRNRAYGNILLLGVPAIVDASTGDGYEYDTSDVFIELHYEKKVK